MTKKINSKISEALVVRAYEIGKSFYQGKLTLTEGVKQLEALGMNSNSAVDYVYSYSNLIEGKLYTRTINSFATDYYLNKIYEESGMQGLRNALLSLSQHITYYEHTSGSLVKRGKDIYLKYLKFAALDLYNEFYPDEVDASTEYSEGKSIRVSVNRYERNAVARSICLNFYGAICRVCTFDFETSFGGIGKGFIHIRHIIDLATIGEAYSINPITDLVPVCPNCHAMLHRRRPAYKIEELKEILLKKGV